jgi:ubiquinol oxidase
MYESLGARDQVRRMRTHYAEADNELHHLLIMEHLGGSEAFADRFLAQHLAFGYFWYCVLLYLLHPRAAYHLSELVEEHAYHTYDAFVTEREAMLKTAPVPSIAREYYSGDDVLETFMRTGRGRRSLESLYDVFCEVRDDEGEHWRTLINLVQLASRTISSGGSGSSGAIGSSSGTSGVSSGSVDLSGAVASASDEGRESASGPAAAEREYELLLGACLADGVRPPF